MACVSVCAARLCNTHPPISIMCEVAPVHSDAMGVGAAPGPGPLTNTVHSGGAHVRAWCARVFFCVCACATVCLLCVRLSVSCVCDCVSLVCVTVCLLYV